MLAKSPVGKCWAGALAREFLPRPDQFATVDFRADDSRQNARPVKRNDLDLPVFMIRDTAREDFFAGNVAQCGDVEPMQAGGCLDPFRGALRLSRHQRGLWELQTCHSKRMNMPVRFVEATGLQDRQNTAKIPRRVQGPRR